MKSFLGNFYRHLAIFSGHTDQSKQKKIIIIIIKRKIVNVVVKCTLIKIFNA